MKFDKLNIASYVALCGLLVSSCISPPVAPLEPRVDGTGSKQDSPSTTPQGCVVDCEGFGIVEIPDPTEPDASSGSPDGGAETVTPEDDGGVRLPSPIDAGSEIDAGTPSSDDAATPSSDDACPYNV